VRPSRCAARPLTRADAACPICFTALPALLAEEELGYARDSPAYAAGELGVTRLAQSCGHVFCRKECVPRCLCRNR
jgi:hypothetical protein